MKSKYNLESFQINETRSFTEKASTVSVSVSVFRKKHPEFKFKVSKTEEGCEVTRLM